MTKLSQCNKCVIGTGIHCEYYRPMNDSECTHFYEKVDNDINRNQIIQICIIGSIFLSWFMGGAKFLIIYIAIIAFFVCSIYGIIEYFKSHNYKYLEMRNLVIETLKQIGCQPEIDKEDESRVHFMFQGEYFFISIENECLVTFYDTWWGCLDLNDSNIDNLKEAINLTNAGNIPKVLYTTDTERQKLGVHSMYRIFLKKEIPALSELFKAILDEFFLVQKEVNVRFTTLNNEKGVNNTDM